MWVIQFKGSMNFYKDMLFSESQYNYLNVIGKDAVFVEVIINYP